jgi:HSP20 family molecular chaperone IbpA
MFPSLVSFFPDMKSWSVGFDKEWDILEDLQDSFSRGLPAYPPYNIKKKNKNEYEIEMAVAGFNRQDLQVEVKNNQIIVEGNKGFKNESSDIDSIRGLLRDISDNHLPLPIISRLLTLSSKMAFLESL